jgi:hypothetical protein
MSSSSRPVCRRRWRCRSVHVKLVDPVTLLPARGAVGERRVEQADEVVAVVATMVVAVSAVPSATALSGPGSQDHDAKRIKSGR